MASYHQEVEHRARIPEHDKVLSHLIEAGLVDWDRINHLPKEAIDGMRLAAAISECLLYCMEKLEKAMTDLHCEIHVIKEMTLVGDWGRQGLVDHFSPQMWQIKAENSTLLKHIEILEDMICTCGLSMSEGSPVAGGFWVLVMDDREIAEVVEDMEDTRAMSEPLIQEDLLISHIGNTSPSSQSFVS
ncbi:hypothetical protein BDM02DRAFT_3193196 [Thelephora ganbajun]|uniref:Uncharacterized protein n=1 Tax=Thelephora ganbajun TaxID=370292 RepID=A0ACB6YYJ2_THEGA|nr:hypothetical protein BDM02DRAFT_3193196 [Thelephora ganbajun]